MKEIYTQHTLNEFFEEFKNLPNSYKIEQVHQLLNNPNAKATHKVSSHFKHLKLTIMTSAFIIGVSAIFLWFNPQSPNTDFTIENSPEEPIEIVQKSISPNIMTIDHQNSNNLIKSNNFEEKNIPNKNSDEAFHDTSLNKPSLKTNNTEPKENLSTLKDTESVSNIENNIIEAINLIELNKNEYVKLGFSFNDSIVYHFSRNGECVWKIHFTKNEYGCQLVPFKIADTTNPNFIFLSDLNGFQSVKWRCDDDVIDKWDDEYFETKIQELIPIVLRKSDFPDLIYSDQVFWFEPSNELFNNLPPRISNDLKYEYYTFISNNENLDTSDISTSSLKTTTKEESNSCNYFEACKSTLNLESMHIYPNPANYSVTIEFNLDTDVQGSISIVNIAGVGLKTLVPNSTFLSGQNSYQVDLSGITPGIYLISINTNKGFKTQRLIVSQ